MQNTLERHGKFDWETIAYGDGWTMPDGEYRYRQRWYERFETGFWRFILATVGRVYIKLTFGARVTGKKNLKALKKQGAITICNHFNYVDTLFVREAVGHFRSYHTLAPWNNKAGAGGHIVRHGGTMPFSSDIAAMRNFTEEAERLLKKGKLVNFYPERSMWWNYQKPRPMKDGAFHYAVKFGVPVLPVFCTFERTEKDGLRKLRIHVLPAIYPDGSLSKKQAMVQMKEAAREAWKNCYEEAYKIPLRYLCDEEKSQNAQNSNHE